MPNKICWKDFLKCHAPIFSYNVSDINCQPSYDGNNNFTLRYHSYAPIYMFVSPIFKCQPLYIMVMIISLILSAAILNVKKIITFHIWRNNWF